VRAPLSRASSDQRKHSASVKPEEKIMSYLGNGYLNIHDADVAYLRDRVAEDFRRVGGRERGVIRRASGSRRHLRRDQRTSS
jgi:hypothetical protein